MTQAETRIDVEGLAEKYVQERDKRLRHDGTAQYKALSYEGKLAKFLEDPVHPEPTPREAVSRTVDVLVVGTGLSGIISAAELAKVGISDILQIDSAGDFGGTWYWNRYPGVRCDTEAYIYMPLLEDTGTIPTERFATGAEIREQFARVARLYALDEKVLFQTRITSMAWDEGDTRWKVGTDRGDDIRARFVILSTGRTHRLKLPGIPGLESFKGKAFHTGRWDYEYTGGGPSGNMENLRDKRVAIIGTGATAVQCVPFLAADAKELYVIQRTPTAIAARDFSKTDPGFAEALEPGWQNRRQVDFETTLSVDALVGPVSHEEEYKDDGGWEHIWGFPRIEENLSPEAIAQKLHDYDIETMEAVRQRVESIVKDAETAQALKPYYYRFCKRPTFSQSYLESFNRPNVHLVDTDGKGADEITEKGVVVDGQLYEVDCLIFATGQEVGAAPPRAGEFSVIGRNGVRLEDQWDRADNVRSLHGIHAHGFPNLLMGGMLYHTAAAVNLTYPLTEQAKHLAAFTGELLKSGVATADVTQEAVDRYCNLLNELQPPENPNCTPGYYNSEGQGASLFNLVYGGKVSDYNEKLAKWRAESWDSDMHVTYLS